MRKKRVLVLVNEDQLPPDSLEGFSEKQINWFKAGYDIVAALEHQGHEVHKLGVADELSPVRRELQGWKPHIVFNLVESFRGLTIYDQNVVSYLELMRTPYTGCNPRGLIVGRDKALSKKILHYHRIRTPEFHVFPPGRGIRRPPRLEFPLIVKPLITDASAGISQASVVKSDDKLEERIAFIHASFESPAIAESFIEGRELYVGIVGNHRLQTTPIWELKLDQLPSGLPRVATEKIKWDLDFQDKYRIEHGAADDLPEDVAQRLIRTSKRIYRVLGLDGYARIDFRLSTAGEAFFLEANPNPDISQDEEFATSNKAGGLDYEQLVQKILTLGLQRANRV